MRAIASNAQAFEDRTGLKEKLSRDTVRAHAQKEETTYDDDDGNSSGSKARKTTPQEIREFIHADANTGQAYTACGDQFTQGFARHRYERR